MLPKKIFTIAIGAIPEFHKKIIAHNRRVCKKKNIPFEVIRADLPKNQKAAILSDEMRLEVLAKNDGYLYIDWDLKLNDIPDIFEEQAGFAVIGKGLKKVDLFLIYSGVNKSEVFNSVIYNAKKSKNRYYELINKLTFNNDDLVKFEDVSFYKHYHTRLGR